MTKQDDELVARLRQFADSEDSGYASDMASDAADRLAAQAQEIAECSNALSIVTGAHGTALLKLDAAEQEIAELRTTIAERGIVFQTTINGALQETRELQAALAEARKDAERYRWLKQHSPEVAVHRSEVTQYWAGDDLDAAIDSARTAIARGE